LRKVKAGIQPKTIYISFNIARGSLFEVITLLVILNNLKWIDNDKLINLQTESLEITKMLNALIKSMKTP